MLYVYKFEKNDHVIIQLKTGENLVTQPQCIVEACVDHFSSIFNSPSSAVLRNSATFTFSGFFLNIPSISDSDVKQAIRHLSSSKCFGPDETPVLSLHVTQRVWALFELCCRGSFPLRGSKQQLCLFSRKVKTL
jgi:hypothetical protein